MKESEMYRTMNANLGKKMFLRRVECQGFPDLFYRASDVDGWVEFKIAKRRGSLIVIPFRPGQLSWIEDYRRLEGEIFLFVFIENSLWIFNKYGIAPEYEEHELIQSAIYKQFWSGINWNDVYKILNRRSQLRMTYI